MEIRPGIHQVDGVTGNSYIIDRENLVVIDTGMPGSGRKILGYITDTLHRQPEEISIIVLTHFHMDHTGGIAVLKKAAPHAKVAVHEADAGYVSGKSASPQYPGIKGMLLRIAEKAELSFAEEQDGIAFLSFIQIGRAPHDGNPFLNQAMDHRPKLPS